MPWNTVKNGNGHLQLASAVFVWGLCLQFDVIAQTPSEPAPQVVTQNLAVSEQLDTFDYAPVYTKASDAWNPPVADRLAGTIEDFNDQSIIFMANGQRRELPSNRVSSIQPVWKSQAAVEAHRLFSERRYKEAIVAIPVAVKSNIPRWQQRLLIAEIVDSAVAIGNLKGACGVFLDSLAPNQPPAMIYSCLPLCWTSEEPDQGLRQAATEWLASNNEPAQLLGASWLLLGADNQQAQRKLLQLQTSKLETIAQLAVAQAWRLVAPPETETKLLAWFEYRERLLTPLQVGPTEFLADRLGRIGRNDLAIGQWSRIASVNTENCHRSSKALQAAQQRLQELGRTEEAKRIQAWIEQLQAVP